MFNAKHLGPAVFLAAAISNGSAFAQEPAPRTLTTLWSFGSAEDGQYPDGRLAAGKNGVLYGTTPAGGTANNGIVFELVPPASPGGAWTETIIHHFNGTEGKYP